MLCVPARLGVVALLGPCRPEQRERLQWPVRLHLCGGGCDQSARWRRIRRVRGERSAGTGAPASLLERLLACRALPDWLTSWPLLKGMRGLGREREARYGQNTARIRDSAIWILRVDISIDAADVYVEALHAPWTEKERMTSLGQMSVSESSSRTRANSNIRQYGCSQIGLAIRTHPTALPQACTLIGAAAMPEIDGDRPHTMAQCR